MGKTIFRKLHLWLSVPFGLIITVVCLSGAALVFEEEITKLYQEHQRTVNPSPGAPPLDEEELTLKLQDALGQSVSVARVVKSENPGRAYLFIITSPHRGAIWIDQYTGEIKDRGGKLPFFEAMLNLHKCFMIQPSANGIAWGNILVGFSVFTFILALLTGIAVWIPKKMSQWKPRANLFSMHALVGIYAMVFLLLMAGTGLTWSFGWWHDMIFAIPGIDRGLITTLHIGTYLGLTSKIIAFVSALVGASLPLTGYWLWYKRIKYRK